MCTTSPEHDRGTCKFLVCQGKADSREIVFGQGLENFDDDLEREVGGVSLPSIGSSARCFVFVDVEVEHLNCQYGQSR